VSATVTLWFESKRFAHSPVHSWEYNPNGILINPLYYNILNSVSDINSNTAAGLANKRRHASTGNLYGPVSV